MRFMASAGLVMILAGVAAYYTTDELSIFSVINLSVGPGLLVFVAIQETRRFQGFRGTFARRVMLRWALILTTVILAVVAINTAGRHWAGYLDFTIERSYTLAEQTVEVCKELAEDPSGTPAELLFFKDTHLARDVNLLIRSYESACDKIDARELLLAEAPSYAQPLLNAFEVTVLACRDQNCELVGFPNEENITNALIRLLKKQQIYAYFMFGHGEVDLANTTPLGFSELAASLRNVGIEPRGLVGPALTEIPTDAAFLILAAPQRDWLDAEIEILRGYLNGGGRALVFLEPEIDINFNGLLEEWGFELPPGVVSDRAVSPLIEDPDPISLLVNRYNTFHAITRKMGPRTMTLLPGTRAVLSVRKPEPDDRIGGIAFSSEHAWIESDTRAALQGRPTQPDPGELGGREIPLVAAGSYPREGQEARLVIFGDRDFASNRRLPTLYNVDLLLNAVRWLAEDERHIGIRAKTWTPHQDPFTLQQTLKYFYSFAFLLPEVLLLIGINAWYRQRG